MNTVSLVVYKRSFMTIAFTILFVIFAGCAIWYACINDFSSEILGVQYPAVGTVLFCFYLAYKSVVIDAPPEKKFTIVTAFVHDWGSGDLYSVYHPRIGLENPEIVDHFEGIGSLGFIPSFNAFSTLNFRDQLKADSTNALDSTSNATRSVVEFALFDWMTRQGRFELKDPEYVFLPTGHSGFMAFIDDRTLSESVAVPFSGNQLIKAAPKDLSVPKGTDSSFEEKTKTYSFRSPQYEMNIGVRSAGGGVLSPNLNRLSRQIYASVGANQPLDRLWLSAYRIEVTLRLNGWRRFSKVSILTQSWFSRLETQMKKSFSWDLLMAEYKKAP